MHRTRKIRIARICIVGHSQCGCLQDVDREWNCLIRRSPFGRLGGTFSDVLFHGMPVNEQFFAITDVCLNAQSLMECYWAVHAALSVRRVGHIVRALGFWLGFLNRLLSLWSPVEGYKNG